MLERVRRFLEREDFDSFKNAADFADQLLGEMADELRTRWGTGRVINTIRTITRGIYEFYRLRDATPFGGDSPVKLRFGGPDNVSVRFIERLDHWYFSKFSDNTSKPLREFFVERYLRDGAALFGRESTDELDDFRRALGERYKDLTDRQIRTIVTSSVQRARNWAHIGSLAQAEIEIARVVATLDARTTELCRELDGKLIRVGVAQSAIERLTRLEPGEFALEMYEGDLAKALNRDPVKTIEKFLEADGKTISDELVATGRGFPPYHANCRTRLEGVIPGVDEEK